MNRKLTERERVENHKEAAKQEILNLIPQLDKNSSVELMVWGGDGPSILILQNANPVLQLAVYHGVQHDYRPEYLILVKEILAKENFTVLH